MATAERRGGLEVERPASNETGFETPTVTTKATGRVQVDKEHYEHLQKCEAEVEQLRRQVGKSDDGRIEELERKLSMVLSGQEQHVRVAAATLEGQAQAKFAALSKRYEEEKVESRSRGAKIYDSILAVGALAGAFAAIGGLAGNVVDVYDRFRPAPPAPKKFLGIF